MINQFHILIFIITFYLVHRVQSDSLPPVYKHGCVILANQKIYCYGGANRQGNSGFSNQTLSWFDSEIYNHHVYLDVSKPLNVSAANTQWQPVPPSSSAFQLEPRCDFAMINHNDTGYTIVGGAGPSTNHGDQSLVNVTVDYNADSNTWGSLKSTNDSQPKLNMSMEIQMFGTRGVKISNSQYMIAGGIPPNNNTVIQSNSSYVYVESADSNWGSMTAYTDPITRGGNMFPEPTRVYRAALATSGNGNVYFFGGMRPINATRNYDYMDFRGYYTFDYLLVFYPSQNQTFNSVKPSNPDSSPSTRELHTVTSIPNTNKMLLYGGVSNGANFDFCYTYDTVSGLWTIANFTNGDGAGRRYGHQAVMVGNDLLYIIGGIDATNTVQNDVHILNVTSMTWLNGPYTNTYDQMNGVSSSSDNNNNNNNNNNNGSGSSSLSGGAIAGIVIGCVAALALGTAAAVIFYMQRKKKHLLASGTAPAGFAPTTPSTTNNTKEYDTTNTSINDGSTTLYSSNPADGTSGHASTPGTIKPSI
ncbi:uncharacterized protein BX664DRAFT_389216 [Halteromyces radiatus]|uniref:uncharacterized protein n=1 Tax=Halteromyces radiatus TaxID=101107 RepID=UPI00221E8D6A|nr:uncharacterized protein BX664DRAFT_389216 [Halteromyces radiatus]KAI8078848.1 hypothetical protein BX664DRAFT_389216 [Halteromyces radiatus]